MAQLASGETLSTQPEIVVPGTCLFGSKRQLLDGTEKLGREARASAGCPPRDHRVQIEEKTAQSFSRHEYKQAGFYIWVVDWFTSATQTTPGTVTE